MRTAAKPKTPKKAGSHQKGAVKTRSKPKKEMGEGADKGGKRKIGRPPKKERELLDAICEGIASGKSARAMCDEVGITYTAMKKWLASDEEFVAQYARAKEDSADYLADEIISIADQKAAVTVEDGKIMFDPQFAQLQRLRVDARKWVASKLKPKKYGDKMDVDHGIQAGSSLESLMGKLVENSSTRIRP